MSAQHTGDLLFHCWSHLDQPAAYEIFAGIVEKGFLLTINSGSLDSFQYHSDGTVARIDVMQYARACFTEIPKDLMHTHGYGHFGLGFTRETMIKWGACPAWYLPNHPGSESLKEIGTEIIRGLHASMVALENFRAMVRDIPVQFKRHIPKEYLSPDFEFEVNFSHGPRLKGASLIEWIEQSEHSLRRTLSFIKEMSPRDVEDYRYLYEREWRIVDGIRLRAKAVFRELTDAEKRVMCKVRSSWGDKIKSDDINVQLRFGNTRLVDHFRYFDGIDRKVSQDIEVILVPDQRTERYVRDYVAAHSALFRTGGPWIEPFPSRELR